MLNKGNRIKKPKDKVIATNSFIRVEHQNHSDLMLVAGVLGITLKKAADEAIKQYLEKHKNLLKSIKNIRSKEGL